MFWSLCRECLQQARPQVCDRNIKYKVDRVERDEEEEEEDVVVAALPVVVVETETGESTDDEYHC